MFWISSELIHFKYHPIVSEINKYTHLYSIDGVSYRVGACTVLALWVCSFCSKNAGQN